MAKKTLPALILTIQAMLVIGLGLAIQSGSIPLGVPGEWEWLRIRVEVSTLDTLTAIAALLIYSACISWLATGLDSARRRREVICLGLLLLASIGIQLTLPSCAPEGYGLTKWVTLGMRGSSGYHEVAKRQAKDIRRFWADYPVWIQKQDALHIGTHPPGLFLTSRVFLDAMESSPTLARLVDEFMPTGLAKGFRGILGPIPRPERSALVLTGLFTLIASAATVIPLYLLARGSGLSKSTSFCVASLWPVLPSAILFQPTADTAFPLLSTSALAFAIRGKLGGSIVAGIVLAIGMQFSLAFLAIGLAAGLMVLSARDRTIGKRFVLVLSIGAGFLAASLTIWIISGANPFVIWWWNQRHHARFYAEFPRSYGRWVAVNGIELLIAIGLPTSLWIAIGFRNPPRVAASMLLVLAFLTLSGRSLSEIPRLWLPMMPPLLVSAGSGLERLGIDPRWLAATAVLVGLETLMLQTMIQVVYPF